jgi:hypothetical protein
MIIGDVSKFAIESEIWTAYERLGFFALGFFVVHIRSHAFGVRRPDATLLACSVDAVKQRIAARGSHTSKVGSNLAPEAVVEAFLTAFFGEEYDESQSGSISLEEIESLKMNVNNVVWAPDGDEAFDDGSYILQFDIEDEVRLVAFQRTSDSKFRCNSIVELWLDSSEFYGTLEAWYREIQSEWKRLPKNVF